MIIYAMVAMTHEGLIGKKINGVWSLPWSGEPWSLVDMKLFMRVTKEVGLVIMGSKTYESMPSRSLPGRSIIVMHHSPCESEGDLKSLQTKGSVVHYSGSPKSLLSRLELHASLKQLDFKGVVVAGGAQIYEAFQDLIEAWIVTTINVHPSAWRPAQGEEQVTLSDSLMRSIGYDFETITQLEDLNPVGHPCTWPKVSLKVVARDADASHMVPQCVSAAVSGVDIKEDQRRVLVQTYSMPCIDNLMGGKSDPVGQLQIVTPQHYELASTQVITASGSSGFVRHYLVVTWRSIPTMEKQS